MLYGGLALTVVTIRSPRREWAGWWGIAAMLAGATLLGWPS